MTSKKKALITLGILIISPFAFALCVWCGHEYLKLRTYKIVNLSHDSCFVELRMRDDVMFSGEVGKHSETSCAGMLKSEGAYAVKLKSEGVEKEFEGDYDSIGVYPIHSHSVYIVITPEKQILIEGVSR